MLIQLPELPVHREDVHVVVLLEVPGQQFHGMVASLQALLILVDLFHLWEQRCCVTKGPGRLSGPVKVPSPRQEARVGRDQPKSGFGMREGGPGVKTVLPLQEALVQSLLGETKVLNAIRSKKRKNMYGNVPTDMKCPE